MRKEKQSKNWRCLKCGTPAISMDDLERDLTPSPKKEKPIPSALVIKEKCLCACHENKLRKPYLHDNKCCDEINGFVPLPQTPDWMVEFDKKFPDGLCIYIDKKGEKNLNLDCDDEVKSFISKLLASQRKELEKEFKTIIENIHGKYALREKLIVREIRNDVIEEILEKLPKEGEYGKSCGDVCGKNKENCIEIIDSNSDGFNSCLTEVKQIINDTK